MTSTISSTTDSGTDPLDADSAALEARVRHDDRAHVFHSWSAQAKIDPLPIARASGSYFWDFEDQRYLDFSSQLVNVNIGYQHPKLVAAIQEQAGKLCTIAPSFANDARSEAARLIAEIAPGDLNAVFFTNGGAEANENAVRMARLHTGRHKVLAAYRSYHGATAGAIALTGDPRRWPSEPGMPGIVRYWGPYPYRSSFHADTEQEEGERALAHLRDVIAFEGPDTVAAIGSEMTTPPSGTYPELTPLAKVIRSGLTPQWSTANHSPHRPKPAMTSSAIITMPSSSHSARTPAR